jgi:hypothetical protein
VINEPTRSLDLLRCRGCPNEANIDDVDGMNLCAKCFIAYSENGKLIDKTKYDEDGEPYMEV